MDMKNDMVQILKIHSKVIGNEVKAHSLVLHEAYWRGRFYDILKKKLKSESNFKFLTYCQNKLQVSKTTVYVYLNVYKLIHDFPTIMLSGLGVTQLSQKRKKIYEAVKSDDILYHLLTTPFEGINYNFVLNDPTSGLKETTEKLGKMDIKE